MMKALALAVFATATMNGFASQDPITTLPDSYAKQFENEWVRVVRVYYPPHAKLPAHAHNALPAAYVYLNDGGPVLFKHIGTSYGAATRPATKAGGFRVFRGIDEIHEVENPSELPSQFLRVEFKTDPKDVRTLKGRFYREVVTSGESLEKVQFENEQVRITRLVRAPGQLLRIVTAATEPSLLIALREARIRESDRSERAVRLGQERWLSSGVTHVAETVGTETSEFLRFDFKTAPIVSASQR
ncbi:MAG TPA: hypothetical protein VFO14_06285 [Vicinamibacterales bacterium]|nr:hypothetical protein [Vicinamibacterales bacterium]